MAMAKNPDICKNLRKNAVVKQDGPGGRFVWEFFRFADGLLNIFEVEQVLQLQKVAMGNGIGTINGLSMSKLVVLESIRYGMEKLLVDDELLSTSEKRINTLIEGREKELGANFSEETKKSLREEHKNQLSRGIGKITPELIRGEYYDPSDGAGDSEGEKFLQILERVKVLHDKESEFAKMLSRAEKAESGLLEIRNLEVIESEFGLTIRVEDETSQHRPWWKIGSWLPKLTREENNAGRLETMDIRAAEGESDSTARVENETGRWKLWRRISSWLPKLTREENNAGRLKTMDIKAAEVELDSSTGMGIEEVTNLATVSALGK
ncbi:MAG: hypothetical protein LBB24_02080 [Rickettsiales bacterium]|jgi:hypothetical protein|nr:hypothetical protein [Rickettsiales bacterium]